MTKAGGGKTCRCFSRSLTSPGVTSNLTELVSSRYSSAARDGERPLFGLSIESIGVALGFSIVLGVSAAVGALIPFVRLYPALLLQHTGALLFSGLTVVAIGVSLCALAGRRRELELDGTRNLAERPFKFGLACSLASGVLASMMNLGISFGGSLLKLATDHGASRLWCANILWPPLLAAGAIPNIAYCLYLMRNRRFTTGYSGEGLLYCWSLSVLMGLLWFGGHVLYGMGISSLGAGADTGVACLYVFSGHLSRSLMDLPPGSGNK